MKNYILLKYIFITITLLHGLIHLIGFFKAFNLAEVNQINSPISKLSGVFWFVAVILFIASVVLLIIENDYYWATSIIAVIISQVLIFTVWSDARFGTIANLIILVTAAVSFAQWNFNRTVSEEIKNLFNQIEVKSKSVLAETEIESLPLPVQKWLITSGAVGKEKIYSVRLKQSCSMKLKPEQEIWYDANAVQYFTVDKPAFLWKVKVDMMPLVFFTGRDLFLNGKGNMLIKILSMINIVNAANEKIDRGSLQRYLGEIVWFPTAAVNPYIKWETSDSLSAKATMTYKGTTGSAMFYFNEAGDFIKFSAMRYKENTTDAKLYEWIITADEIGEMKGIRIPVKTHATWKLENGEWTWLKLELKDIEYNIASEY